MAALMVPFGLKSFFGLYPESCRFLIYRRSLCANVGVAAVADSSTAAARALNEIIVVFLLYLSVADPRADRTRRSRFVRRACCLDRELYACSIRCGYLLLYVRRPHAHPIKFRFNKSTRLETRVTESIACGPAFVHNKADCGATGRRDEIMPREHGGDSTPEWSAIPRALVI